jgi:hypothetical protein
MKKKKMIWVVAIVIILLSVPLAVNASTVMRGQIVQFGSPVTVEANETIQGDVVSFFGTATIRGRVEGDLVGFFSPVQVEGGEVLGDTAAIFAPLSLRNAAIGRDAISIFGGITADRETNIDGSAISVMGSGLDARQAQVRGDRIDVAGFLPGNISGLSVLAILIVLLLVAKQVVAFVIGVLAIVIFPERFEQMSDHAFRDMGKKTLVGFLLNIGIFVLIVILAVTVVGAPLIPLVFPAFMLLEFAGNTTMKIAFGRKISRGLGHRWGTILELFIGTLIYLLLQITLVGNLFTFIFKLIGIGQVVDSRFGDQLPEVPQGGFADAT